MLRDTPADITGEDLARAAVKSKCAIDYSLQPSSITLDFGVDCKQRLVFGKTEDIFRPTLRCSSRLILRLGVE